MGLTPEQKKLLDETIERRVAAHAARKIHRLIADDKADDWKGKRFAAVLTSVVLAAIVLSLVYFAVPSFLNDFSAGVVSPDKHRWNVIGLSVGITLAIVALWLAVHLATTFPRPGRFGKVTAAAAAVLASAAGAAYWFGVPVVGCATGVEALGREAKAAVPEFSRCLASTRLTEKGRIEVLRLRAEANYRSDNFAQAAADMEAVFDFAAPNADSLIHYARYLRRAKRLEESLAANTRARELHAGEKSVALENQRGVILRDLGRDEEAVAAFSEAIAADPAALSAYWNRGNTYERLGKREPARADFVRFEQLLVQRARFDPVSRKYLDAVRAKLELHD